MLPDALVIFLQLLVNAILEGSLYAVMGVGFALILDGMGLFNLAHGAFYVLGGYVTYYSIQALNLGPVGAIVLTVIFMFGVGFFIERAMVAPARVRGGRDWTLAGLIVLLALSVTLSNLWILIFGPEYRGIPSYVPGQIELEGITIESQRLISAVASFGVIGLMYLFLSYTKVGLAIRGLSQNTELSQLCGITPSTLNSVIFGLGTLTAGVAGSLLAPIYYVSPASGDFPGLMSFVVVVIAGLGSIKGLTFAGIIIGAVDSFSSYFFSPEWGYLLAFAFCFIILSVRPTGLFGIKKE